MVHAAESIRDVDSVASAQAGLGHGILDYGQTIRGGQIEIRSHKRQGVGRPPVGRCA